MNDSTSKIVCYLTMERNISKTIQILFRNELERVVFQLFKIALSELHHFHLIYIELIGERFGIKRFNNIQNTLH